MGVYCVSALKCKEGKMEKTKWAGKTNWTPDQKRARRIWRRTDESELAICNGLRIPGITRDRVALHKRLDVRLDQIEKRRAEAIELFPEVDGSFTIMTMRIRL